MTDTTSPPTPAYVQDQTCREIYDHLKRLSPDTARGHSRSRKYVLMELYTEAHAEWTKTHFNTTIQQDAAKLMDTLPAPNTTTGTRPGRIHTIIGTHTGRPSCKEPNIQPAETDTEPLDPDKAFIMDADYSQIELRVIASLGGADAVIDGVDPHTQAAATMFGVPYDEVTGDQRDEAKLRTYGARYGATYDEPPETPTKPMGRADEVRLALRGLPPGIAQLIQSWQGAPPVNRKFKRRRAALGKKIRKYLPLGVTLAEAAAVL